MLSPVELAARERGQDFKRYIRAAAALNAIFDDAAIGEAVGVGRGAVGNWWLGSRPSGAVIFRLADATGLSPEELNRFVYYDGPPPTLPEPGSPVVSSAEEGVQRDRARQQHEAPDRLAPSPERRSRGSGAGRG